MSKELQRLKDIEARKAELKTEIAENSPDEERLRAIKDEADALTTEEAEVRSKIALNESLAPGAAPQEPVPAENRTTMAERFVAENRMSIPMFRENRSLLISSGTLATPTAVSTEIGQLPNTISSIVDDVYIENATGTGEWKYPYKKTDATAADVTEGQTVGGTGATYDFVTIGPKEVGVLDEVSNQVSRMSPVDYASDVQGTAYLALRAKVSAMIVAKVKASAIAETIYSMALDENYLRNVILGFGGDEEIGGETKLYINKTDLGTLGRVRGSDKKPVYEITKTDANNGIIKEGGMSAPFSINKNLATGEQLYGQPKSVKLLLWGDYEVSTDDGGDYFKRNMLGVRGLATAGTDLAVLHGMQLIKQAAQA